MEFDRRTALAGLATECDRLPKLDKRVTTLDRKLLKTAKELYRLSLAGTVAAEGDQLPTSYQQMYESGHPVGEGSLPDQAQQAIRQVQDSLAPELLQFEQD